jgi:hypothetical protein
LRPIEFGGKGERGEIMFRFATMMAVIVSASLGAAVLAQGPPAVRVIRQSEPVIKNDARFQVVLGTNPVRIAADQEPVNIDLALHITNLAKKSVAFETFDTISVSVRDSNRKDLLSGGGRDWTGLTPPIELPSGGAYAIRFDTKLFLAKVGKKAFLLCSDATGLAWRFGPLSTGAYTIEFGYQTTDTMDRKDRPLYPYAVLDGQLQYWRSRLATNSILVDVELP